MSTLFNFTPVPQGTVSGAVTGVAADITIVKRSHTLLLTNIGNQTIFWKVGTGGASASADCPLLPNSQVAVSVPPSTDTICAIAAGAGSTLYVTPGVGN
jgi:hypothetical protein